LATTATVHTKRIQTRYAGFTFHVSSLDCFLFSAAKFNILVLAPYNEGISLMTGKAIRTETLESRQEISLTDSYIPSIKAATAIMDDCIMLHETEE